MSQEASVWEEDFVIPTYPIGEPEKNPMFLENRVYQGSSGVVYPHPVIEKISDQKVDQVYRAVFLENEYIKVMILPELGGRIQMAFDKVRQRHFVYYNQVIKPALVGLTGPWISGGIEFNWPQHHRPSTFQPVDFHIKHNPDGSKTVWLNEVERMFRTKGMAAITVHPGKAFIEIAGKLYNRTPFPQTFLWWANPAVKVNDDYQSIFPPDVYAVFDHGKRDVSSFPEARGVYYKVDYAPGTDISRYKNIPVPTSYMAITSKYNFIGGYEHDTRGGLLHVADHHVSPGKKQWTWGNGAFGQAWDRNLTDEDGPYIELMTGVFTDNQPDFSWLQPYEQKEFVQYFLPYAEVGVVSNATKELVLGTDLRPGTLATLSQDGPGAREAGTMQVLELRLYASMRFEQLKLQVIAGERMLHEEVLAVSPVQVFLKDIPVPADCNITDLLIVCSDGGTGRELLRYQAEQPGAVEIPGAAEAAKLPADIEQNEQLFLTGQHLEQYRHATYDPKDYYREALRRDPADLRCNNAMGLLLLRQGKYAEAEPFFRTAVQTATRRNPNPYDGEAFYNLGWSLMLQQKRSEAFDAFYKSTWNQAWQHAGFLNLARIAASNGQFGEALQLVSQSMTRNWESHSARHLKCVILRKLGRHGEAARLRAESLELDPFNFGCLFEDLLAGEASGPETLIARSRGWVHNFIEYAFDYLHAGMYDEAIALLKLQLTTGQAADPMLYYYLGWMAVQQRDEPAAREYYRLAAAADPAFCFPNRVEDVCILQTAIGRNPGDARAPYYLGNFWYHKRAYDEAIVNWERSVSIDPSFPTAHRNLSLAYYNKQADATRALASLERSFALDTKDARILMELDQLKKRLNHPQRERLAFLQQDQELVMQRDDLYLEQVTLFNQLNEFSVARELMTRYRFHPWEGGEGKVVRQHLVANLELAMRAISDDRPQEAIEYLSAASIYPDNLGEGKLHDTPENDVHYLRALALEASGSEGEAIISYGLATQGNSEPAPAIFYNDPQPDKILYQGLAWLRLGNPVRAREIFDRMIVFGEEHLQDHITIDYFAVSLPELLVFDVDLDLRNRIHCLYVIALGNLGLLMLQTGTSAQKLAQVHQLFDAVLSLDVNHQGAMMHQHLLHLLAKSAVLSAETRS